MIVTLLDVYSSSSKIDRYRIAIEKTEIKRFYKFVSVIDVNLRWLKHHMLNNMFHSCEVWTVWYALGEPKIYSATPYFSKSKLCRNNWNS